LALFGKREKEDDGPVRSVAPVVTSDLSLDRSPGRDQSEPTTVGPALRVKGEMSGQEDVTVEGRIEGMVSLTGALTVASGGVVEADIRARAVIIEGRVLGNIIADDRVEIRAAGHLDGNIKCPKISIHEGAQFRGNVDMSAEGAAPIAETDATTALPVDGPAEAR